MIGEIGVECRRDVALGGLAVEARARRVQRFLAQPFFVAEQFTGNPGAYIKLEDTVKDCADILAGKYDDQPENWFYMVGGSLSERVKKDKAAKK